MLGNVLQGVFIVSGRLYSDCYLSYPGVASNLGLFHNVVNHSRGFVILDGTHTKNIEGFWSHLKGSTRNENGVKKTNIDE